MRKAAKFLKRNILYKKCQTYFENCMHNPQQYAVPARGWRRFDEHCELKGDKDKCFITVLPSLPPFRFYSGHLRDFYKQQESNIRVGCPWLCQSPCLSSVRHYILPADFCSQLHHCPSAPHCQFSPCRNPSFPTAHLHLVLRSFSPQQTCPCTWVNLFLKTTCFLRRACLCQVGSTQHQGSSQQPSSWKSKKLDKIPGEEEFIPLKRKGSRIRHIFITVLLYPGLSLTRHSSGSLMSQQKSNPSMEACARPRIQAWRPVVLCGAHCRRDFFMIIILKQESL